MNASTRRGFFGVVIDPQSYINSLYLLLAFPLGIAYFVFLVTGISVGVGLLVIWVGVPILVLVLAGSWLLCEFERVLAIGLLKEDIGPISRRSASSRVAVDGQGLSTEERLFVGVWRRLKDHLANRTTWTGMLYLLLRFPLGIATFTIVVTLVSVSVGMIFAPTYMWTSDPLTWGSWTFDPFPWSFLLMVAGIPVLFVSMHLMNGAAFLSGRMARVMLGRLQ